MSNPAVYRKRAALLLEQAAATSDRIEAKRLTMLAAEEQARAEKRERKKADCERDGGVLRVAEHVSEDLARRRARALVTVQDRATAKVCADRE